MKHFPKHLLKPLSATVVPVEGALAKYTFIEVLLKDIANDDLGGAEFDPLLRLGYIKLPKANIAKLAGQSFDFPTECENRGIYPDTDDYGCIEGTTYFAHANQPVYVSRLAFGALVEGTVPLGITGVWDLSSPAVGLDAFAFEFTVPLQLPARAGWRSWLGGMGTRQR